MDKVIMSDNAPAKVVTVSILYFYLDSLTLKRPRGMDQMDPPQVFQT